MQSFRMAALAAALCAAGTAPAAASVVFDYLGPTIYDGGGYGTYAWPITGYIAISDASFAPNATLTAADLVDLSFVVSWSGLELTFALAELSWIWAEMVVDATGEGFASFALGIEQELYAGLAPTGPETLLLWDVAGSAIGFNDQRPNEFPFDTYYSGAVSSEMGALTLRASAVPAPAALPLLGAGALLLGLASRRRGRTAPAAHADRAAV
ncbi:hypothetical protein [Albimonas pacifica]|uniref:PEP-CTERM protein-sorting domain-containing protein n=1 Tax=Albimonas pacifica TaxID=1114924 RepID=A0A1I3P099_9RHOB|nr:hypothetical protein [Albimonas pacifica]SFJ14988.1 PEP-CTERM protein-sorting domain-containing protein [Albimonas pacifica]